jgi:glycyl-tRNA synthetase
MFQLKIGATGKLTGYLRPETAQGAYLNFLNQFRALREKIPMGLAIIGKAYRNEISPRQGFFRVREFTQAELQIFHDPMNFDELFDFESINDYRINLCLVQDRKKGDFITRTCKEIKNLTKLPDFYIYHMAKIQQFYLEVLEFSKDRIRFYEKSEEERAFYNQYHFDIEFKFQQFDGFEEIAGLHYRGDHDLLSHQKMSNKKLEVTTTDRRKIILNVLELSFGVDRNILAVLDGSFQIENGRNILKIPPILAPYHIGILPLQKKDGLPEKSIELKNRLSNIFRVFYDEGGSIGKRYARLDEIGVPFCLTVDYETLDKDSSNYNTVTIRFRDTRKQIRIKIEDLIAWIENNLH